MIQTGLILMLLFALPLQAEVIHSYYENDIEHHVVSNELTMAISDSNINSSQQLQWVKRSLAILERKNEESMRLVCEPPLRVSKHNDDFSSKCDLLAPNQLRCISTATYFCK